MKVCLNHWLTSEIDYIVKDEKSWLFSAYDFSTGEITPQQFCIRFGKKNVAEEFKNAIDDARNKYLNLDNVEPKTSENEVTSTENNDIKTPSNDSSKVAPPADKTTNNKPLVKAPEFTPPASFISSAAPEKPLTNNTVVTSAAPIFGVAKLTTFNSLITNNATFGSGDHLSLETLVNKDANESENFFAVVAKQNLVENKSIFNTSGMHFYL